MKFIKEVTELEQDLKDKQIKVNTTINEVTDILSENEFSLEDTLNGMSFNKIIDKNDHSVNCQFYIDRNRNTYSSYVTTNDDTNNSNYSQKGSLEDSVIAVNNFIKYINNM